MKIRLIPLLVLLTVSPLMPVWADEDVSFRLKAIEAKQDEILNLLAELKEEIQIVKVRTTR